MAVWVIGFMVLAIVPVLVLWPSNRDERPPEPHPYDAADDHPPDGEGWTLGDWRNAHEGRRLVPDPAGWMECGCCGCPAMDASLDFPECEVCGWEGDVEGMDAARRNLTRYGSVRGPASADPSAVRRERKAALDVVEICAMVTPGQRPDPGFWPVFEARLDALRRVRGARP